MIWLSIKGNWCQNSVILRKSSKEFYVTGALHICFGFKNYNMTYRQGHVPILYGVFFVCVKSKLGQKDKFYKCVFSPAWML